MDNIFSHLPPLAIENMSVPLTFQKLDYSPSVSVGDLFQDSTQIPKSVNAQVSYIKWNRTIHNRPSASADSQPAIENAIFHLQLVKSLDAEPADKEG